jgi:hypothetical protein
VVTMEDTLGCIPAISERCLTPFIYLQVSAGFLVSPDNEIAGMLGTIRL